MDHACRGRPCDRRVPFTPDPLAPADLDAWRVAMQQRQHARVLQRRFRQQADAYSPPWSSASLS